MPRAKKINVELQPVSPESYGSFIQGLEIRQVFLLRASTERFAFPESNAILSFDITDTAAELTRFDDGSGFSARLPYTIDLLSKLDGADSERFASISVTYEVIYSTKISITDSIFEVFKDVNLKMNLWAYVREYVQSSTLKMGLPGLILPHLKA